MEEVCKKMSYPKIARR